MVKIINCLLYKRNVAIFIDDFMSIKNKEKLREFIERIVTISEHHNTSIIPISIVKDKTKNILNVGKPIYSDFNIDDLQFSKKSENLAYSPINLKLNEIATISLDDIEVIKV